MNSPCDTYGRTHVASLPDLLDTGARDSLFNCLESPDGNIWFCVPMECLARPRDLFLLINQLKEDK